LFELRRRGSHVVFHTEGDIRAKHVWVYRSSANVKPVRRSMGRIVVGLAVLAIAFGGGLGVGLLTRSEGHTRTVQATTVEGVNGSKTARLAPTPIPTLLEGATDPHRLALSSAVPIDANLESADYVTRPPRQLIVTWLAGNI
jgi:hypothetical protein